VTENDSAGEFIYLAAEVDRYTHDRALLEAMWPHVEAAARYLDALRRSERTDGEAGTTKHAFYGMLPASISHEGYSEKPIHSYWDDFWALKGFAAATDIATALRHGEEAIRLARARDDFAADLTASLRATAASHRIDYLPGSAELGDFDPTSSTIAFAPGGDASRVPTELVAPTYERYWRELADRRDGRIAWRQYTPYELRNVGAFVRLGERDRARQALDFFLAGRRPEAWNQWAEVVGRDAREPRFIGDMPHAWVASDFIRATLDLFAYERGADRSLVLAAGIPAEWLDVQGIAIADLRTPYGRLSYSLRSERGRLVLRLARDSSVPPGGFVLTWPGAKPPQFALINGRRAEWHGAELKVSAAPATVVLNER
jgi:hypothetical protein